MSIRNEGIVSGMNETCGQGWPDALLANWVAVAARGLFFFVPPERACGIAKRRRPSSTSKRGGEVRSRIVPRSDPGPALP